MIQIDDHPEPHRTSQSADLCRRDSKSDWLLIEKRYQCKQIKKDSLLPSQEPLESTFATYKTSALGLVGRSSRRKPRYLWRKCHHKRSRRFHDQKDLRIDHQSFYGDFVGHCAGFLITNVH